MLRLSTILFSFLVILMGLISSAELWWIILPISFVISNLFFPKLYILAKDRIIYFIYFLIAFLRYVFTPFLFILAGNNYSYSLLKSASDNTLWVACFVMVLEIVIATALINLFASNNIKKNSQFIFTKNHFLYLILFSSILILLINPDFLSRYNFILLPEEIIKPESSFSGSGFLMIISDYILIIPPLLILNYFLPRFYITKKSKYVVITLMFLLPFLLFFKGTSRFSALLPALSWMILFVTLLPQFKRKIIASIISTTFIVMVSVTLFKQFGYKIGEQGTNQLDFSVSKLAMLFNAYFSGLYNVGYSIDVERFYITESGLYIFFNDLMKNLVFFSSYANMENTSAIYYNNYVYSDSGQSDQIIPVSGQSYLYFGLSGSFFMTFICVLVMIILERKLYTIKKVNYLFPMALSAIYFSLSMMVSLNSIYPAIFNFILPFFAILFLNDIVNRFKFK